MVVSRVGVTGRLGLELGARVRAVVEVGVGVRFRARTKVIVLGQGRVSGLGGSTTARHQVGWSGARAPAARLPKTRLVFDH